jgi:hypothetical protein
MELQKRNSFDSTISLSTQQLEVLILYLGYQEIISNDNIYQYPLIYINIPLFLSMQNKKKIDPVNLRSCLRIHYSS